MARLTREESKARTRTRLMEAAGKVFACRGLERATVDEVAGEAGYTKGAFYANFESKEALFLAMLDERFAERLEEIDRVLDSGATVTEQARMAGQEFNDHLAGNPEWSRLFFEFAVQALRDERFRAELVARQRALRERIAAGFRNHSEALGAEPPLPAELVAAMTYAMADGFALARLLEPESVPEDMFGSMLEVFFTGLEAMAREAAR
ncbi:MAG TPA: TetR family transcriptional regulator [Solirubrobacteraceae bacterium]|jgi:AcrR family transcriptional regulator|nr:TetR family transcriptional regulator [Solirubrobacteraceae bacterium]